MKNELAFEMVMSWIIEHEQVLDDFLEHFDIRPIDEDETEWVVGDYDHIPKTLFDAVRAKAVVDYAFGLLAKED